MLEGPLFGENCQTHKNHEPVESMGAEPGRLPGRLPAPEAPFTNLDPTPDLTNLKPVEPFINFISVVNIANHTKIVFCSGGGSIFSLSSPERSARLTSCRAVFPIPVNDLRWSEYSFKMLTAWLYASISQWPVFKMSSTSQKGMPSNSSVNWRSCSLLHNNVRGSCLKSRK